MAKENVNFPELSLFHLASPDLERLIAGQVSTNDRSSRETTTINTSDLNVLNLVSPDVESIFSTLNAGEAVEKQHEMYTKTFIDALHKIQSQPRLGNKESLSINNVEASRQHQRKNCSDRRNEQQHIILAQDPRAVENKKLPLSVKPALIEEKNRNKIGTAFTQKSGKNAITEDGNRNTIRIQFGNYKRALNSNPRLETTDRNSCFGSHANPDRLTSGSESQPDPSTFTERNIIEPACPYPDSSNLNPRKPNSGNRANPNHSKVNLESHPELFKLQSHAKLSRNTNDRMEELFTDAYSSPHLLPLPPIDLHVQEIVKRERKKQKNRVAASKCRKKKLEREAQLEIKVEELRKRNRELATIANALKSQLTDLKQRVVQHIACGCHVTIY